MNWFRFFRTTSPSASERFYCPSADPIAANWSSLKQTELADTRSSPVAVDAPVPWKPHSSKAFSGLPAVLPSRAIHNPAPQRLQNTLFPTCRRKLAADSQVRGVRNKERCATGWISLAVRPLAASEPRLERNLLGTAMRSKRSAEIATRIESRTVPAFPTRLARALQSIPGPQASPQEMHRQRYRPRKPVLVAYTLRDTQPTSKTSDTRLTDS